MNCPAGAREAGLGHAPAAPFYRVSPCGARYFPSDGKVPKGSPGDAADGHFVPIGPLTPGPPFTGVTPWVRQKISGAQNLSGWSEFPPGHWALGLQKFRLVRSRWCAWLYRANAPGANPGGRPKGLPYPITEEFLEP